MRQVTLRNRSDAIDNDLQSAHKRALDIPSRRTRRTLIWLTLLIGRRIRLVDQIGSAPNGLGPGRAEITRVGLTLAEDGGLRGLAEAWALGEFAIQEADAVLSRLASLLVVLSKMPFYGGWNYPRRDRLTEWNRGNSVEASVESLAKHYDLDTDFFKTFLDESLAYSSAVFQSPSESLAEAQQNKYRLLSAGLPVLRGASVLEIGCGWGGLAQYLVEQGAVVTAVSASASQVSYCRSARPASIRFVLGEYRATLRGKFDAVISCEMIEGVGAKNAPDYMRRVADCLNIGGHFALQAITTSHRRMLASRLDRSFVDKYIAPGGQILSERYILECAFEAGFALRSRKSLGASYAVTLMRWRNSFRAAHDRLADSGCSEGFLRCWDLYFSLSIAGFSKGDMNCQQLVFAKVR